jgi:hypothetical protein
MALGMPAGVALWFGAALAADAQVIIDPSGPTCVAADSTRSDYVATVTTLYDFWLDLKVFHDGVLKHDTTTYVVNAGPAYLYTEAVFHTGWGLHKGDELNYRGRATIAAGPFQGMFDEKDWIVIVKRRGLCPGT